jgi:NADPH2:quinone reductase
VAAICVNTVASFLIVEITNGAGVPVVYDSVGKDTFDRSIDCLRPFGMMVSFGNASGPVPPIDFAKVLKGSLFTRHR